MKAKGNKQATALLTSRVPESLRDTLNNYAQSQHRTTSQQIALILTDYVRTLQDHVEKTKKTGQTMSDVQ